MFSARRPQRRWHKRHYFGRNSMIDPLWSDERL
jgi:hypothetical protein